MATSTRAPVHRRPPARDRASSSLELWTWFFMRVSGLLLLFLVLGHFTIMHFLDGGVDRVNFAFVAGRWASPFWQTYDWLMLFLALLHGSNGMRVIVDDYVRRDAARAFAKATLYTTAFVFLLIGSLVILTFDPAAGGASILPGP